MAFELSSDSVVISDSRHASICSRAYSAHIYSQPIKSFQIGESTRPEDSERILRGLANIALGLYGNDYHGLSKEDADLLIADLSGSIDDFIFQVLSDPAY